VKSAHYTIRTKASHSKAFIALHYIFFFIIILHCLVVPFFIVLSGHRLGAFVGNLVGALVKGRSQAGGANSVNEGLSASLQRRGKDIRCRRRACACGGVRTGDLGGVGRFDRRELEVVRSKLGRRVPRDLEDVLDSRHRREAQVRPQQAGEAAGVAPRYVRA
jgi:hypothetical protein